MRDISCEGFTNRQIQIIAVCTTCLIVSTIAIALRLLVRRVIATASLWWDDWVAILALVTCLLGRQLQRALMAVADCIMAS